MRTGNGVGAAASTPGFRNRMADKDNAVFNTIQQAPNLRSNLADMLTAQIESGVRIKIDAFQRPHHSLQRQGRRTQRILVGSQLGYAGDPEFALNFLDTTPGFIRPQRFDVWRNQGHSISASDGGFSLPRRTLLQSIPPIPAGAASTNQSTGWHSTRGPHTRPHSRDKRG